jgi:hypothetical protein
MAKRTKRILRIRTRGTWTAMKRLVAQLDRADLRGLRDRVPGGKKRSTRQWVDTLKRATRELKEWCPPGVFTIDVPPKRRRRRT